MPTNKFVQFQNILRNFNPNTETPVQLYKKIEDLFGEEHQDIVEDFLLFLKPGQAVEVGRFMDRFQLVRMTEFINMLHVSILVAKNKLCKFFDVALLWLFYLWSYGGAADFGWL